jgi:hypothetical protein
VGARRSHMSWRLGSLVLTAAAWIAASAMPDVRAEVQPQSASAIDKAFDAYWKADDPNDAAEAAHRLVKAGIDFDTAWARLAAGRDYKKEKTGQFLMRHTAGLGAVFENRVEVPADYDPSRPWPVRVQLHGGVGRPAPQAATGPDIEQESRNGARGDGNAPSLGRRPAVNRIPGDNQIYVYPSGWAGAEWWHAVQIDNILRVVDRLKRRYNVDESRVHLTGISDGGTGAYFMALKNTTAWSAFLPLNGSVLVLGNPDARADGEIFLNNLANKPLYIVNGGRDHLYPVANVQTHVERFKALGVPLVFNPQPNAGHDTSWWPHVRGPFEAFVREHPRVPHPETLSWETERTDRYNRAHWLVIETLGSTSSDAPMAEGGYLNRAPLTGVPDDRRVPSGRVDIARQGNAFAARTRGVRAFRLLLSPDVIDFTRPVVVTVNGRTVFDGPVRKDPAVLLAWAARDNDRTMLYGAELSIRVP